MEIIKKYKVNRKMYSTNISKYVTIDYIFDLIKTNQKFKVVDSKNDNINLTNEAIINCIKKVDFSDEELIKIIKEKL